MPPQPHIRKVRDLWEATAAFDKNAAAGYRIASGLTETHYTNCGHSHRANGPHLRPGADAAGAQCHRADRERRRPGDHEILHPRDANI